MFGHAPAFTPPTFASPPASSTSVFGHAPSFTPPTFASPPAVASSASVFGQSISWNLPVSAPPSKSATTPAAVSDWVCAFCGGEHFGDFAQLQECTLCETPRSASTVKVERAPESTYLKARDTPNMQTPAPKRTCTTTSSDFVDLTDSPVKPTAPPNHTERERTQAVLDQWFPGASQLPERPRASMAAAQRTSTLNKNEFLTGYINHSAIHRTHAAECEGPNYIYRP